MILKTKSGATYAVVPTGLNKDGKRYAFFRLENCVSGYIIGCIPTSTERNDPQELLGMLFDRKLPTEERLPKVGDHLAINPKWWPEVKEGKYFFTWSVSTPVVDILEETVQKFVRYWTY